MKQRLLVAGLTIAGLLTVGTALFRFLEGWSWADSFYFTGMTITTVGGYAGLAPSTPPAKVITVLFALCAVGMGFVALSILAQYRFHKHHYPRLHKNTQPSEDQGTKAEPPAKKFDGQEPRT